MTSSQSHVAGDVARRLLAARQSGVPTPRPATLTLELARLIRHERISMLERDGPVAAYKMSLSTGTWGALSAADLVTDGSPLRREALIDPLLEAELAFRADEDLTPDCTIGDILDRCSVVPAIEIADSAWAGWCPSDPDHFVPPDAAAIEADNAMSGRLAIGAPWLPARALRLPALSIVMTQGDRLCAQGRLGDVMGDPAEAVRWLIRQLAAEGRKVRAGQIVSSGCPCSQLVTVPANGGEWNASIEGLGSARIVFV